MSGGNVTVGVDALMEHGVKEEDIYVLTLFATPKSKDNNNKIYLTFFNMK